MTFPRHPIANCMTGWARASRDGYYSESIDSTDTSDAKPGLGDALDDLVDIELDLEQVLRRWELSEEDAVWHFGFLFRAHWGQRLRSLQLHLHERAFRRSSPDQST